MDNAGALTRTGKVRGTTTDVELRYATALDPALEHWRVLAAAWLATVKEGKAHAMQVLKHFLVDYLHDQQLATDPAVFLCAGYPAPCFYKACLSHIGTRTQISKEYGTVMRFLDFVLTQHFSVEDDDGKRIVPPEFRNPIPPLPEAVAGHRGANQESDKSVLPYRYIEILRGLLCPPGATTLRDWLWAQAAGDSAKGGGGDWFVVDPSVIDVNDPDCMWRERATTPYERATYGYGQTVHELWSPVRAVALYLKLQLPLRTYQVRMLDSGEADTWRYAEGQWGRNSSPLAQGTEKNLYRRGVFRRMKDLFTQAEMTGLYINTNKTADRDKDEWSKGYELPWQHALVLYWLEKLRDWQAKYNPITAPTPWTSLAPKHLGQVKSDTTLKAMGTTCFLFRDATAQGEDRFKPITNKSPLDALWYKLLAVLENQCEAKNQRDLGGAKLVFVKPDTLHTTYYPLHSLRVSLITAYALEGGVPMTVLSKCIAGHARLIMTLYYTKVGIGYVSETMAEAEKRLMEHEQANYVRWLKDASYRQLEANGAFSDPAAIQAVLQAQGNGASLIKDDKGLCPKGGFGCDSGGVYVNDDSGSVSYGEVPGYPQKNCPRCRWFLTGPAFLGGLQNHWNTISLHMGDVGERIVRLEGQITALEDERYECEANDRPFLQQGTLDTLRKTWQAEMEKNNKLAHDLNATLRLIARCHAIANAPPAGDGVQLVAAGGVSEVRIEIQECGQLQQVLTAVAGATVFPEHDVSKAVLQAGRAYDLMLAMNGKVPLCFRLTEDELLPVVQHMTRLLQAEAGSIKAALPFVEGMRRLAELGLDPAIDELVREVSEGRFEYLDAAPYNPALAVRVHRLLSHTSVVDGEASHVD